MFTVIISIESTKIKVNNKIRTVIITINKFDFLSVSIDVFASNAALIDEAYNLTIPVINNKIIMLI
ncbi:hypothetical protein FLGSB24_09010 [Flavobacterium sp. GSB-24]|nr:hypothetical protein FLGSB24_09010 [Flavobacterium sp. GSB-24]